MAAQPVLIFQDGRLAIPEQLRADLNLHVGSELRVVSSSPGRLTLEFSDRGEQKIPRTLAFWASLKGGSADRRTPEWETEAAARKDRALKALDSLRASGTASASDLKHAERGWELADDEFDAGPFTQA